MSIVVLEDASEGTWGVSLNGSNPAPKDFLPCRNREDAFTVKARLGERLRALEWELAGARAALQDIARWATQDRGRPEFHEAKLCQIERRAQEALKESEPLTPGHAPDCHCWQCGQAWCEAHFAPPEPKPCSRPTGHDGPCNGWPCPERQKEMEPAARPAGQGEQGP